MNIEGLWLEDSEDKPWINPTLALQNARWRQDVVQGLVPLGGITWLYGPSMSFKTFVAMSMAAAVSKGLPWLGRQTEDSTVIYIAAEGGEALSVRRAAAELDLPFGRAKLFVYQERPKADEELGAVRLRGLIASAAGVTGKDYKDPAKKAAFDSAVARYGNDEVSDSLGLSLSVFVILDTYSQTSNGDDKANVVAYVTALRDMIDDAARQDVKLTFLVIDHVTKSGDTFLGSVAKLNDVDSQIELVRSAGQLFVTAHHRKIKDGAESKPVNMELVPFAIEGFEDAYGQTLQTLVVRDGSRLAALESISSGKAGLVYTLIKNAPAGSIEESELRAKFRGHADNAEARPESVAKAFRRSVDRLLDDGLISEEDGRLTLVPDKT